jgi:molybdate transport system substrate-binding protein
LGGVEVARRVVQGEDADVVVLSRDAIDELIAQGHVRGDACHDLMRSLVAAAWPVTRPRPDLSSLRALQQAVLEARSIAYSTGPSGLALIERLGHWGLLERVRDRLVQAPPGVPVGRLLAQGQAELGFQQRSELMGMPGIDWALLPEAAQIVTVFSGAVTTRSKQPEKARQWLDFCAAMVASGDLQAHGMEAA